MVLDYQGQVQSGFQVNWEYFVKESPSRSSDELLDIKFALDDTSIELGEQLQATASIKNTSGSDVPMVMVELPIPPGCELDSDSLSKLPGNIEKFEIQEGWLVLYLTRLKKQEQLNVSYKVVAKRPAKVVTKPARTYLYYRPESEKLSSSYELTIVD